MGRWTQDDSDAYRLPEGIVRVAYDSDTGIYTFRDKRTGKLYHSAPGATYGTLYPVLDKTHLPSRPNAFAPEGEHRPRSQTLPAARNTTFHDLLPAHAITTSTKVGSRSPTTTNNPSRSQSTRVPASASHATKHSRSKSVYTRTPHERDQRHTHRDQRQQTLHQHVPDLSPSPSPTKSGFFSAVKSLSRSLTTVRDRTRKAIVANNRSSDDRNNGYERL